VKNEIEKISIVNMCLICSGFPKIGYNARLYAVGRGISASCEIFWPSATDRDERNSQFAVEPRLPYTALLGDVFFVILFG
jgi:hypothetical protein